MLANFSRLNGREYICDECGNLYVKEGEIIKRLSIFDKHFYNLRVFSGVPVLEIDGLRMQPVKDFGTPLDYSRELIRALKIKRSYIVIDTCMGLGYTALEAARKAALVRTFEVSKAVIMLAQMNPFSQRLFELKTVRIEHGDITEKILNVPDGSIDVIIHDPPRLSIAPSLYSLSFYSQLARVLRPFGKMFHYVGAMGRRRRRDVSKEVMLRLSAAGFSVRKAKRLQGLFAFKRAPYIKDFKQLP
ncbi:MAG: methyltransferase domain-containing protein [Candidatus Bilamarchaeaceae archaeon]